MGERYTGTALIKIAGAHQTYGCLFRLCSIIYRSCTVSVVRDHRLMNPEPPTADSGLPSSDPQKGPTRSETIGSKIDKNPGFDDAGQRKSHTDEDGGG